MASSDSIGLAQQLGEVQGMLKQIIREGDGAREDRGKIFDRISAQDVAIAKAAASAESAAEAAAEVARSMGVALEHITNLQEELSQTINPAIVSYLNDRPVINEYRGLRAKAAGVVLVLLTIGWIGVEVLRLFMADLKKWLGW